MRFMFQHSFVVFCVIALLAISCSRPVAKFTMTENVKALEAVSFTHETLEGETYLWDFGDGNTSTEASPSHKFYMPGIYDVRLTVTNANGKQSSREQTVVISAPERCLVLIETPFGNMVAEIFDTTPLHQDNFIKLVEQQYYDSLLFHRVIQGFMVQGGDPNSRDAAPDVMLGTGGPDYTTPAEFVDSLAHVKGALAAARTNNPQKRSSGSQFYIVQGRPVSDSDLDTREGLHKFRYPRHVREKYMEMGGTPFLDQEYTVFGQVIEGLEVIDRIAAVRTDPRSNRPQEDVWMVLKLIR